MNDRIFDSAFLKKLDSIALNVRMIMGEGMGGNRKSRSKGSSVEFSDFREYSAGDDFRRIDWNAYGRFDKLFVKLFMEEREAMVNVFIDGSRSMAFGEPKKSDTALKLAGVFAFLALNNLDRVCINSVTDSGLRESSTITGKAMFDRCISFLEGMEFTGRTDLDTQLKRKDFRGWGISFVISDFFTPGGIETAVKYMLFKKQEVVLVQVLSPEELNPGLEGQIRLQDSETGQNVDVSVTPALLRQYNKELAAFTGGLRDFCSRLGAAYVLADSSEPIEKLVFEDIAKTGIIG